MNQETVSTECHSTCVSIWRRPATKSQVSKCSKISSHHPDIPKTRAEWTDWHLEVYSDLGSPGAGWELGYQELKIWNSREEAEQEHAKNMQQRDPLA